MFRWRLTLWLMILTAPAFAQEEGQEMLSHFSLSQAGNAIRVILTIEAGTSSCNGIELERSTGGEFQQIALIPGICGGSEFEETYVLLDGNPVPGIESSYRVNLGNVGRSAVLKITYVELQNGIAIFPNPATARISVIISEEIPSAGLTLYNSTGQEVWSVYPVTLPGDVSVAGIPAGTYTLVATADKRSWQTKLVIAE